MFYKAHLRIDPELIPNSGFNEHEFDILSIILTTLGGFSFILGLTTCLTYLLFKKDKTSRFILCMSVCITCTHFIELGILFNGDELLRGGSLCFFQGMLEQYFAVCAVLWWFCITLNMYLSYTLVFKKIVFAPYMHLFCWLTALALTVAPAVKNQFGIVGLVCWIVRPVWQFFMYFAVMGAICVIGGSLWLITAIKILKMRQRLFNRATSDAIPKYIIRQLIFICWFLLLFGFMFTHRLYIAISGHKTPFGLAIIHTLFESTQGSFLFMFFVLSKDGLSHWKNCFQFCTPRDQAYQSIEN